MAQRGTGIGWGKIRVVEAEPGSGQMRFSCDNSPLAEAYGPSDHPVCHLLTGALTGLGLQALGPNSRAVETACAAMGAERCEFVVGPAESPTEDESPADE